MLPRLKIVLLVKFLFIVQASLSGQAIRICDRNYLCQSALDAESGLLYFLTNDTLKTVDVKNFSLRSVVRLGLPEGMESVQLVPVCLDHELYFVNNLGGQVFKYEQGAIRRIDRSFTHKMQLRSAVFAHDDRLFRYGGYGFWSFRNFFTYFDPNTREWEIFQPAGSDIFPPGSSYGTIVKILGDDWHIVGGQTLDQRVPLDLKFNDQYWVFNKTLRRWNFRGTLQKEISLPYITSVEYGDKVVIVYLARTFVLDLKRNRMKEYLNTVPANSIRAIPENFIKSYFYDGNFLILAASSSDENVSLTRVRESDFLSDFVGERPICQPGTNWLLIGIPLSLVTLLILLLILRQKKQVTFDKIRLSGGKIVYNSREITLEKEQFELLALFLRSAELSTNDLLEFHHHDQLHYSQNIRTINSLVDEINIHAAMLIGKDIKVIQKQKSSLDKRIKVYSLQKKYFA